MKKTSTFQVVFLVVFGVLALGGIFVFATYSGSSSTKVSIGNVVIWGVLPSASVRSALASIEQQDQSYKGVSYVGKKPATFETDLSQAIATGQGPDLILISQEELASLSKEIIPIPYKSLPQRTYLNTFADIASLFLAPQGVLGIPIAIDPLVLYYNRMTLSSAGIAAPPRTWAAVAGLAPHIVRLTGAQNVVQGLIAMGAYKNVHNARGILSTLFLQTGVPIVTRDAQGGYKVSLGVGKSAGAASGDISSHGVSVLRFYTEFADPTKVSYTWNSTLPDSQKMFLAGKTALYIGYASEAKFIAQANPNLSFGVAPIPQLATAQNKTVYAKVYALAIPRGSKNSVGALLAASGLSSPLQEKTIADKIGFVPSLRKLLALPQQDPITSVAYTSAIMSHAWLSPSPSMTDKIFSSMIQNVITGKSSISQALTEAMQLFTAALQ